MNTGNNERIWIEKAKNGDRRAFKQLYETHVESLFRFMRQYSGDVSQVEDWVQRAFIKAYHHVDSFKGNSRFATWLFSIALNEMRSDVRRKNIFVMDEHGLQEQVIENEEERFAWDDSMKMLLQKLDEQKRSVFLLYEVEGYSHSEIASMLNMSENASRTLLCRAKQWLRTEWEQMEKAV